MHWRRYCKCLMHQISQYSFLNTAFGITLSVKAIPPIDFSWQPSLCRFTKDVWTCGSVMETFFNIEYSITCISVTSNIRGFQKKESLFKTSLCFPSMLFFGIFAQVERWSSGTVFTKGYFSYEKKVFRLTIFSWEHVEYIAAFVTRNVLHPPH